MTVLAALAAHYERLAARGRVAPVGYAPTALSFVVEIDASGEVIDFIDMRLADSSICAWRTRSEARGWFGSRN